MDAILDINSEFGVEDGLEPGGASASAALVPQSLINSPSGLNPPKRELAPEYMNPRTIAPWPPKLIFDLAMNLTDLPTILTVHNLTQIEYDTFMESPMFRRELAAMTRELAENGVSFRQRARVQAETYLMDVHDIVQDPEVAAATRLDAIKSVVKWGDLEPKQQKQETNNANQVNIQINFDR